MSVLLFEDAAPDVCEDGEEGRLRGIDDDEGSDL